MYKCRDVLSLMLICSLEAVSKLIYVNEPDTWFNAIETCRRVYNGTLGSFNMTSLEEDQIFNESIWNGRYQMTSSWLTIEGCYERPLEMTDFHSDDMSIAMCSQFCSNEKYFYFAIQGEHCDCLTNFTTYKTTQYNVSDECFNTEVQTSGTVQVFGMNNTGIVIKNTTSTCLLARCTNGTLELVLVTENCNESLHYICRNHTFNSNASWNQTKEACITNYQSFFIKTLDASDSCAVEGFWVESRRYHGITDDHYLLLPEVGSTSACTYINYQGNISTQEWTSDCFNSSRKKTFFCKSEVEHTSSSSIPPSRETTLVITNTTPLQIIRDKTLETGIVIGGVIGGVAVTIIGIILLVILLKRKRSQHLHHKSSIELKLDSRNSDIQRTLGIDILNNRLSDTAKKRDSDKIFTVDGESGELNYRQNSDLNGKSHEEVNNECNE